MKIIKSYPPNFREIVKVFPMARKPGVIFAYAPYIYAPPGAVLPLTPHLEAHEAVHLERQQSIGVEMWWKTYLQNRQFRYEEELFAHIEEYRSMIKAGLDPEKSLLTVATRLASPLYSCGGGIDKAAKDILNGATLAR